VLIALASGVCSSFVKSPEREIEMMHQYCVAKLLVIHSVKDTVSEGLRLENEVAPYLRDGLLVDITVVRECMTGLEQLNYALYDVIIVFNHLDFVTGEEFVRILRVTQDYTPVMFVTDYRHRFDPQSYAREHGFSSILMKPLNPEILVNEILNVMNTQQAECESESAERDCR
jgi:DNA-binding response OmpR family regulator